MSDTHSKYYDSDYFEWQRKIGEFGGKANTFKFLNSIDVNDTVIDFGCGGGFLLNHLSCKKKIGIEPNQNVHQQTIANGVEVYLSPSDILEKLGNEVADVIISNHALEHTLHPLVEIKALFPLLKKGGKIHFVVPCDSISYKWKPNDVNHHLYSWSPMNLGNLFTEAGFKVIKAKPYIHKWPPRYYLVQRLFGWRLFNLFSRIYGRIERTWYQVQVLAVKE